MPSNAAAWIIEEKSKPFQVKEAPYPTPGPTEILVKNGAVAVNPVDWKLQDRAMFPVKYPAIFGMDVSGEVVEVGADVKDFKKGDRVMGETHALLTGNWANAGFQQYSAILSVMAAKIPENIPYEEAVVLPLAISTAAAGFYEKQRLALPHPSLTPQPTGKTILIWGGSSSVGAVAIQLALASGLEVITTASSRNFDLVKKLGASQVFDHTSKTVVDEITDALKGKTIVGAYDAISTTETIDTCAQIVTKSKGEKMVAITLEAEKPPAGVTLSHIFALSISKNEVAPAVWGDYVPRALAQGALVPAPGPLVVGHGLENVQKGLDKNREGVSAAKVVITL